MKECEICWSEYQESKSNQKYCPECGKDPYKARKHYEIAEYINKVHAGDLYKVPEPTNCVMCGNVIYSSYGKQFCSTQCLEIHRTQTAKCKICGELLISKGNESGRGFCTIECKNKHKLDKAIEEGHYVPCEYCKKMFIRKDYKNRFCGQDCFRKHRIENKPEPMPKRIEKRNCKLCKKEFICKGQNFMQVFCSRECGYEYARLKAKAEKEAKLKEKEEKKKKEIIHLCTICKTSQFDCERFTSKFRYQPKGARQIEHEAKLIIVQCPKYK